MAARLTREIGFTGIDLKMVRGHLRVELLKAWAPLGGVTQAARLSSEKGEKPRN